MKIKINLGDELHTIVCMYPNYDWKKDDLELAKIKRLVTLNIRDKLNDNSYELKELDFNKYVQTYSVTKRNNWRTKEQLFKSFKDNYKRLNTRFYINKLLMCKKDNFYTKSSLIEDLIKVQDYLKQDYIDNFTKHGEFVDSNNKKINMKSYKWKLNLSYSTITNMLLNNSKKQISLELENLHKSWDNLYLYIKDEPIFDNCKTCYDRLVNNISNKILTYVNYEKNLNKVCDERKLGNHKLTDERKNQFLLLWKLFNEDWTNKEILESYSDMFSLSVIRRERTKYNKECREKNNISDNTTFDDIVKCKDIEKFKLFLSQDKFSYCEEMINDILYDFELIINGKIDESMVAYNKLKGLLE